MLSSDFDNAVAKTHKKNWPEIPFVHGDLSNKKVFDEIKYKLKSKNIDVIVGGPPCQGFSIYGKRRFIHTKKYDPHIDSRNKLIFTYLNYVKVFNYKNNNKNTCELAKNIVNGANAQEVVLIPKTPKKTGFFAKLFGFFE